MSGTHTLADEPDQHVAATYAYPRGPGAVDEQRAKEAR